MKNIEIIKTWVRKTIIGLDLCPFAKQPFENGHVRINICESVGLSEIIEAFTYEIELLNNNQGRNQDIETTLLGLPNISKSFEYFNDLIFTIDDILAENNLENDFQVVGFHPEFRFEGTDYQERVNAVNRSPLPLIHILKTESITKLKLSPNEGEKINLRNEKFLNSLSQDEFHRHFAPYTDQEK